MMPWRWMLFVALINVVHFVFMTIARALGAALISVVIFWLLSTCEMDRDQAALVAVIMWVVTFAFMFFVEDPK